MNAPTFIAVVSAATLLMAYLPLPLNSLPVIPRCSSVVSQETPRRRGRSDPSEFYHLSLVATPEQHWQTVNDQVCVHSPHPMTGYPVRNSCFYIDLRLMSKDHLSVMMGVFEEEASLEAETLRFAAANIGLQA